MKTKTEEVAEHLIASDASIPAHRKTWLLAALRSGPNVSADIKPQEIVKRAEFALRAKVTERVVDMWAKQGLIQKVRLPGRARGLGFRASDVDRLLAGLNPERAAGCRASEVERLMRGEVGNEG
jgi:hypothetical protein